MTSEDCKQYIYAHKGILQMCQELHMHVQGSSDTIGSITAMDYYKVLSAYLPHWEYSSMTAYDGAVYLLIQATLTEAKVHYKL